MLGLGLSQLNMSHAKLKERWNLSSPTVSRKLSRFNKGFQKKNHLSSLYSFCITDIFSYLNLHSIEKKEFL